MGVVFAGQTGGESVIVEAVPLEHLLVKPRLVRCDPGTGILDAPDWAF